MLCALKRWTGAVSTAWPLFDWLVALLAELITGACVRGRNWEPRLAKQVMARRPTARVKADAELRWDEETYLGAARGCAEHCVADNEGKVHIEPLEKC